MKDTVEKFLNRILRACEGKRYLFRGTTQTHSERGADEINSSLYRWARGEDVFHEKYRPLNVEKKILEKAERHFADRTSNIEMLTDLQHFHGKTNLIDFSRNPYIALFFSCYGDEEHHKEDGELILLDSTRIGEKPDVVYAELQSSSDPFSIEPANTQSSQKRVTFQSSVFVYPPSGYINKDLCKIIQVPAYLKESILDHLQKIHNIYADTIYNDLIGFIANEKNYETASVSLSKGVALHYKNEYEEAIEKYDEAIELNPFFVEAYNSRGLAKEKLGRYQEAIADYNKVIELNPNHAIAYSNRGDGKYYLEQHQEAIADYDKAIELDPDDAIAYNNRGIAKSNLGQHQEARSDFNKAIELIPIFAEAYNNRGCAKYHLEQHQEAISDLNEAIELNTVFAEAYNNRGGAKYHLGQHQEAISDFNKATELNSDFSEAYSNLNLANQSLGRTQETAKDFKMVVKLKGD